tara:strand:- start:411 stop:533 length:123 start_codon:yes stop_codon:yes gene_type:complete
MPDKKEIEDDENKEYLLWKETYGYEWESDAVYRDLPAKPE